MLAQARCVPVNVVDRPPSSSFIMPAIVDRGPITIAISTGGSAPALAPQSRAEIERAPACRARPAGALRRDLPRPGSPHAGRAARAPPASGIVFSTARVGELALHRRRDRRAPRADPPARFGSQGRARPAGMVHLVGAGPGDPRPADPQGASICCSVPMSWSTTAWSSPEVLSDRPPRCRDGSIVGKRRGAPSRVAGAINARLVSLARARQERGAAEGRRSVRVRPRWRGDRGAGRAGDCGRGRARHHRGAGLCCVSAGFRSPIATMPRPACS